MSYRLLTAWDIFSLEVPSSDNSNLCQVDRKLGCHSSAVCDCYIFRKSVCRWKCLNKSAELIVVQECPTFGFAWPHWMKNNGLGPYIKYIYTVSKDNQDGLCNFCDIYRSNNQKSPRIVPIIWHLMQSLLKSSSISQICNCNAYVTLYRTVRATRNEVLVCEPGRGLEVKGTHKRWGSSVRRACQMPFIQP